MTIVITGATGHLGRLAIDSLLAKGVAPSEIVAGGRSTDKLADVAARGVTVVPLDYTDSATLDAAFAGADQLLFISASEPGQRFAQHTAVIAAAQKAGIGHIAYTSILGAETTPHVLAPDHTATEQAIAASGIPATFLRNGWYTENFTGSAAQAIESGRLLTSAGDGRVASASRTDYAEAAAAVLVDPALQGSAYELSGDHAWDVEELAAAVSELAGRPVVAHQVTPEEHVEILTGAGLDAGTAGFVVALDQDTKAGLLAATPGDLARLIGHPTTPLRDGLRADLVASGALAEV